MALQKWAAPAGNPLITTKTDTGPADGTFPVSISQTFGAVGDIAVGAILRISAHGVITTTGSPTLVISSVSAFGATPAAFGDATYVAPAGVTAQPWRIDMLATYDGTNVRCRGSVEGLTASGFLVSEVVSAFTLGAYWAVSIAWDQSANDADSGDTITIHGAAAEWIG